MQKGEKIGRRNNIPVIYTRGTHYEVGYDIGHTFSGMIQNFLAINHCLNEDFLPLYETDAGKQVYEETLKAVNKSFPQYVKELQGLADGAKVPFYKLFLLHMDEVLTNALGKDTVNYNDNGCSDVSCNEPGEVIMAHTEDAIPEVLGHYYIVSAHIISDEPQGRWKVKEERFSSFCYAAYLPGFTMSYNHHGFVFTINTLRPRTMIQGKIPGTFLTRALLAAENLAEAQQILRDSGCGCANGFNVNMTFLNQEGDRLIHSVEVGPPAVGTDESSLCIFTTSPGEPAIHCNKYLRLKVPEFEKTKTSSIHRHATIESFPKPKSRKDVLNILGDQSDKEYSVFRETDSAQTVAVGVFDCIKKTWSLYSDNPKKNEPVAVLPLILKSSEE